MSHRLFGGQVRFWSTEVRGRPGESSATSGKRTTAVRNGRSNGSSERDRVRCAAMEGLGFFGSAVSGESKDEPKAGHGGRSDWNLKHSQYVQLRCCFFASLSLQTCELPMFSLILGYDCGQSRQAKQFHSDSCMSRSLKVQKHNFGHKKMRETKHEHDTR